MAVTQRELPRGSVFKYGDIMLAVGIIWIVIMMIIPVPSRLLDFLLVLNITFSLVILLVTIYTVNALEFSVFPSLLLIMTLFRLALNVSSTRLVLLHGYAGDVIQQFGNFVVGGNPVVGFVVFLILIVIQFIVITRGAERVAEVAARFTLDAMPGKQMSIDADLNAGLINEQEARVRRQTIQREADFYGAMDGASKFVKGDAIAGIIITLINIFGGLTIGMVQRGITFTEALNTYTLLTVGDGLVTQIPALLLSTATGITVTKAASESALGHDVIGQLLSLPRVMAITSGVLLLLGIFPGMPTLPFMALGAFMGIMAFFLNKNQKEAAVQDARVQEEQQLEEIRKPEKVISLLNIDPLEIEMGYALIPLVDANQGGDLLDRVVMIRRQCALELGLVVPPIRLRDNMQLKPNVYVIKIRGLEVARGELMIEHLLGMFAGGEEGEQIPGIDTKEPAFGLPAKWIHESMREQAEMAGYTIVDLPSVVATHLTEVIKSHAAELLSRQDVQNMIDFVKETNPAVVNELIPQQLSLGEVHKVLANLLKERIPIRDLVTILETLADHVSFSKDIDVLTEYVRQGLSRQITRLYVQDNRVLPVVTLAPEAEQLLRESIQQTEQGGYLAVEPVTAQKLLQNLMTQLEKLLQLGYQPVVLCPPLIRLYFKRFTERSVPQLVVLSYNELEAGVEIQALGVVSYQ